MSASSTAPADDAALMAEGRLLGGYILGEPPCEDAVRRYAGGTRKLFAPDDAGMQPLRFAARHPWALPCLDAAAGLLERDGALRRRLLLMLAILEATPQHADKFLPHMETRTGRMTVLGRLVAWGAACGLKLIGGLVLYPAARWRG
jgi:hypothetical protein